MRLCRGFCKPQHISKNAKPKPFYSEPWGQVCTNLHPKHAVQCARGDALSLGQFSTF
jgi:hypothetical protein